MKGATAEPCARTSSPPMPSSTIMIGSIQNFLRSDMKPQKSIRKVMVSSSVRAAHANRRFGFGRLADDPVALRLRLEIEREQLLLHQAQNEREGRDPEKINDAEHDRADDAPEQHAELEPELVQRRQ